MKKIKKICVVIGSRANYSSIKSLLVELKKDEFFQLQIVVGFSALIENYGKVSDLIEKDGFRIEGSAFSGVIKDNFATTSYFTPDFLKRKTWISTQDGTPLEIKTRKLKNKKVSFNDKNYLVTEWEISGDLELTLQYDEQKNWVGSGFTVGNYPASFILNYRKNNIHKIWKNS